MDDRRGINDIGTLARPATGRPVTKDDLVWVLQETIDRAHAHGIMVIGCALTPYGGAGYARENGEAIRQAVNQWFRTSRAFDAVVDFEATTRDTTDPTRPRAPSDPGDHLHPNNASDEATANAVDLSLFSGKHGKAARSKPRQGTPAFRRGR